MRDLRDIIKRPVITENSADLMAEKKQAVETVFGVKVEKVNTMNVNGKLKRMGRHEGYRPNRKKAIVQLSEDSKDLDFFEA